MEIIKQERIGYLKSKLNLMQGELILTPHELILKAHKTGVGGFGILGAILKHQVEKKDQGVTIPLNEIKAITQGKHGVQKNILEVTDSKDQQYRIMVKSYTDWEKEIKRLSNN